jgi:hypothetical protein
MRAGINRAVACAQAAAGSTNAGRLHALEPFTKARQNGGPARIKQRQTRTERGQAITSSLDSSNLAPGNIPWHLRAQHCNLSQPESFKHNGIYEDHFLNFSHWHGFVSGGMLLTPDGPGTNRSQSDRQREHGFRR